MTMMTDVKTYLNYIGGEWVESSSGETLTSLDPATQEVVAYAQQSTTADMERAIAAARKAFESTDWAVNPGVRAIRACVRLPCSTLCEPHDRQTGGADSAAFA